MSNGPSWALVDFFFDLAWVNFYCKFTVKSLGKISENGKISHSKPRTQETKKSIRPIRALAGRSL